MADYLVLYLGYNDLFDSQSNEPIIELPINFIMGKLGYNGLLMTDIENDLNWDRGCVSYEYDQAELIIGGTASY